jgi:hypothetical protein
LVSLDDLTLVPVQLPALARGLSQMHPAFCNAVYCTLTVQDEQKSAEAPLRQVKR